MFPSTCHASSSQPETVPVLSFHHVCSSRRRFFRIKQVHICHPLCCGPLCVAMVGTSSRKRKASPPQANPLSRFGIQRAFAVGSDRTAGQSADELVVLRGAA
eukprot:5454085-Lingulodinium_polyedra.AAC.1